jgi:UDP-glucose 4-epimerase
VLDADLVAKLFREHRFDHVFHLAAYAAEGLSHFIRRFNYENNLIGSMNLINASIKQPVRCLVFTSSIAVYGPARPPMTEETTPKPEDPYGIAKYAVELDLEAAHRMFGLNYVIFRPHNVYGERQNLADPYRNVVGIFMRQVLRHQPMSVFGDGTQSRAFSHIDDVAPIIASAIAQPKMYNQVFNIGAGEVFSVNQLATVIAEAFGVPPDIRHLPARQEVAHAFASHEKIERFTGAQARVSLQDGIRRMAAWAKQTVLQEPKRFENIEVDINLPPSWKALCGPARSAGT